MPLTKESLIVMVLTFVVLTNLHDVYMDISQGVSEWHLLEEAGVIFITTATIIWLAADWFRQKTELTQLKEDIRKPCFPTPQDQAFSEARYQMGRAIQEQFEQWNLTASEMLRFYSSRDLASRKLQLYVAPWRRR